MGGYIDDGAPQAEWLSEKVRDWEGGFKNMAGVTYKHPKVIYMVPQKSLKKEWNFMQHTTQGLGEDLRLPSSGDGPLGGVTPGPLPGTRDTHAGPENHGVTGETCEASNPRTNLDCTGKLNCVVYGIRYPSCRPPWTC